MAMKKKSPKTLRKPTLVEFEMVPTTDPAIQAALDRMRRQKKPVVPAILREHARKNARKGK
jgi:hypothetical protein